MLLAYWNSRGRCEPIRYMLEYLGLEYEKKVFENTKECREQWLKVDKHNTGLEYPNLPYLVDGNVKISETLAIMKYIARKGGLVPQTEMERINCDVAEGKVTDFPFPFYMLLGNPNFEQAKAGYLEKLPEALSDFNQVLGKRDWLAGSRITYIDFQFAEWLDQIGLCFPGCYDNIPNIKKYKDQFDSLEKIAAYRNSDRFQKWPLYAEWTGAHWGTQKE